MWDFLPMERDEYVSAEDDAIRVEQARERARARGANPSDGICPVCDMTISECGGPKAHDKADSEQEHDEEAYYEREVDEGPEFAQEYESPEDVYAEQEAGEDW